MPDPYPVPQPATPMPRLVMAIRWTRFVSVLAVISSLIGALLMFWIGTVNTLKAVLLVINAEESMVEGSRISTTELATLELLECLDSFLVGLAFLYFAYGIYSLFIQLEKTDTDSGTWTKLGGISTLKKTLMEVLIVLLTVVFVKGLLERLSFRGLEWTYLVIPLSILALAASTRLLQFEGTDTAKRKESDP
ncbi:YqhA family protein [Nodosilinea sp. E11]|uniref:YqhA family protein n=1 Tax=Nodosilinea sp. E11 TaxID=3037479 RepID=UPI0029351B20|nr:YqhA family protein [Nodosilinea sp. E11]